MNGSLLAPEPLFWPPFCEAIDETADDPIPEVTDDREGIVDAELDDVVEVDEDDDDAAAAAEDGEDDNDEQEDAEL